jgi:hypothetical protein
MYLDNPEKFKVEQKMIKDKMNRSVQSPLGKKQLDSTGAAIGAARMNPSEGYGANPILLKEYIDNGSEHAWREIRLRINNVYLTVSNAMEALDAEQPFSGDILQLLETGKKLLFKPNMVELPLIHPRTHGPALIGNATPWEFVAAVMRWFHDKCGVSYHQMAMGEAGTGTFRLASISSRTFKSTITAQAVMEGKCGDNYVGWGFYFVRKYLADCHQPGHTDDPMSGYETSLSGVCVPMGEAHDRLLVYDLNKIADDLSNGREVPVVDGINYKSITLHKAIVGGNPDDPKDIRMWPGCVLINCCKLKIHTRELFTCAIKNLGIGLYPMEANNSKTPGKYQWKYALPNLQIPLLKMGIPHSRWLLKLDEETCAPVRNKDGAYVYSKTGGLEASIADCVQAVRGQGIKMLHVVDAIETANISHVGPLCKPTPEGFVFASSDMVAVDLCAARYLFTMVPLTEADKIRKEHGLPTDVIQKVPMPKLAGGNIVTGEGYDSSFSRFGSVKHCEDRGLGQSKYYIVGNDLWQGGELASLQQHLGRVDTGVFSELLTTTLYHTTNKPLWDLQAMCLAYLELNDKLTGSDFKRKIMEQYDENKDGIIDYMETGPGELSLLMGYGMVPLMQNMDPFEALRFRFLLSTTQLKYLRREWNPDGHCIGESAIMAQALVTAFALSKTEKEMADPFFPKMQMGKGKWPSMQFAMHRQILSRIYGQEFPGRLDLISPYGTALSYADARWNEVKYGKSQDAIGDYHKAVSAGSGLLPFTFYVPKGFGASNGKNIPNVEETDNKNLVFTAGFPDKETWKDLKISSFHLK